MEKKYFNYFLTIAICFSLVACNSNISTSQQNTSNSDITSNGGSNYPIDTNDYTISFYDGTNLIKSYVGKPGDFVDIPKDLTSSEPRQMFDGWYGIDDMDFESGKVEIFSTDQTYYAKWTESFGSNKVYSATSLYSEYEIVLDGIKDEAFEHATKITVAEQYSGTTDTTADVYIMYDDNYFYLFSDVKDATPSTSDSFEIWVDLLHDDSLASLSFDGSQWGETYRGEPGPMCEAHFQINAGFNPTSSKRFGNGSSADWVGWWSNECNNDGVSAGKSVINANGYTVEYKIKADHVQIPEYLRLEAGNQIGVGIKVHDGNNVVALESFDNYMNGPKRLSNVDLIANPNIGKTMFNAIKVRSGMKVLLDNKEDNLYKDSKEYLIGNAKLKTLWDETNIYVLVDVPLSLEYLELSSPILNDAVRLTVGLNEIKIPGSGKLLVDDRFDLTVNYKEQNKTEISETCIIRLISNSNEVGEPRNLFTAKKLESNTSITIDGVKDNAYNDATVIDINKVVLTENGAKASEISTYGKAYARWDDNYLYVFVDVFDKNVNQNIQGTIWFNDSVELWINTCRTLPSPLTKWGEANRPYKEYCGEGQFRLLALKDATNGLDGTAYLYDAVTKYPRDAKSILSENGYTAEYKIPLGTFAEETDKVGQIIDLMININEGASGKRTGVISTNYGGQNVWEKPAYMDHLLLVE